MNQQSMFQSSNEPKRVAYIYDGTIYGGVEIYVQMLLQYIDRSRYSPVVVIPGYNRSFSPPRFIEEIEKSGVPLLVPPHPGNSRGISFLKDVKNLAATFKNAKIDVVHIQTSNLDGGRRATLAAKLAGVKAVVRTEHVPPSTNLKRFSKYIIKPFDFMTNFVVTDSNSNRDEQINLLGRKPEKVYRSYCGIETEKFEQKLTNTEAKRSLGLDPELPVVGAIGRLAEQKGHKYFVDAAATIIREFGPVQFLLVGNGPLETELREQVEKLGLTKYFHFAGFQSEYIPYMEAMDIAVMSSIHEGFSLTMLEFMAMGKPCVFTDHPSFQEAVIDGESGLLVPMRNGEALGQGVVKLLKDPEQAAQLGRAAKNRVRKEFSIERLLTDMMGLYDRMLGVKHVQMVESVREKIAIS